MTFEVRASEYSEVESLQELNRQENNCQLIHDSQIPRGLADVYLVLAGGRVAGYAAVKNRYDPGRLMEFYVLPQIRGKALEIFREVLAVSKATHIAAQTNCPLLLLMLFDCARNIAPESILFYDAFTSHLSCPRGDLKQSGAELTIEAEGAVMASGGFLCHYNPPYGDIYMEVKEPYRKQGLGSYLVQELKRISYEAGKKPAARCNFENVASRRTLQRAGLLPCGNLLVGEVDR